ncbi:hypothetical protein, partial [Microbispora bryophytorum]|uniref:hypothetical protein n=1 Tax=Microbispora bryophytorum TaxID=1460882 RepID=UPI0033C956C4
MRRSRLGRDFVRLFVRVTVAIQVALLSNLISPGITWAAAQSGPPPVSVELPSGEAPKQLTGTAGGLPHLVDSAVTRSEGLPARKTAERPKGSLPVEQWHKTSGEPAEGGLASPPPLPSDLRPSPALDAE